MAVNNFRHSSHVFVWPHGTIAYGTLIGFTVTLLGTVGSSYVGMISTGLGMLHVNNIYDAKKKYIMLP